MIECVDSRVGLRDAFVERLDSLVGVGVRRRQRDELFTHRAHALVERGESLVELVVCLTDGGDAGVERRTLAEYGVELHLERCCLCPEGQLGLDGRSLLLFFVEQRFVLVRLGVTERYLTTVPR